MDGSSMGKTDAGMTLHRGRKISDRSGNCRQNKIVIMGGSYGGYATLAGLAFPRMYMLQGVDIVGPSNLFTLLDSVPAYWEAANVLSFMVW